MLSSLLAGAYVILYIACRASGRITHFADTRGYHEIKAIDDPWSEVLRGVTRSNTVVHAFVLVRDPSARFLNAAFSPLMKMEEEVRKRK